MMNGEKPTTFDELKIHDKLKENIRNLGFSSMMPIQAQAVPLMINGSDVLAAAKTGSGKTLAFLIPMINFMLVNNVKQEDKIVGIIISPTRELTIQTYEVAEGLVLNTGIKLGMAIGGTCKNDEIKKLKEGVNLLIATPGRLVDHMLHPEYFKSDNLKILVIDEADRILGDGFKLQLDEIIKNLPKQRQTALFSATQTKDVDALAGVSFQQEPIYIGVDDESETSTAAGLTQSYIICPADKRFRLLITFLRRNKKKKIMVFFSTRSSVRFHSLFFSKLEIDHLAIHGDQSIQQRVEAFNKFRAKSNGILLCTDVAARGLDFPSVDWVIQYDPPTNEFEYIHRVGRSARAGSKGHALLFLMENEKGFLKILENSKVKLNKLPMPNDDKLTEIYFTTEKLMTENRQLLTSAKDALRSYLMSYERNPLKDCFNVEKLDIEGISKSFGFNEMPYLDIKDVKKKEENGAWIKKEKAKNARKTNNK